MSVASTEAVATPSLGDIREIVHGILRTLKGDLHAQQVTIHAELEDLSKLINNTRAEIARTRVVDIRDRSLPAANDELDAVVEATEHATHAIMTAVESIEAIADEIGGDEAIRVREHVTAIYEACGFQDITGQRIRKVVKTMQEIDFKIAALIETLGPVATDPVADAEPAVAAGTQLQGPQRAGDGVSQADIDALFA
jgi:chemotaxis protein CheZ